MISLRPAVADDDGAMSAIFVASRRPALSAAGLPDPTIESILTQQFAFQRAGYRASHPSAAWEAIIDSDVVVGRIVTDTTPDAIELVDIVVAPDRQGAGVGSAALAIVIDRADASAVPVRLHVDRDSRAEAWYRRHGFELAGSDQLQFHMVRPAQEAAPTGRTHVHV